MCSLCVADWGSFQLMGGCVVALPLAGLKEIKGCRRRSKHWPHATQCPPPLAFQQLFAGEANCRGLPPTFQRGDEEGGQVFEHRDGTVMNLVKCFKTDFSSLQ
mmetsp:Transcript_7281/g.15695  ORF Transcript_7281/g.15695 Transcript_7281/m.15695 type:complete len:103 (+) Transcript_7281:473-781(+)